MTPSVIEAHERSKRFHADIARKAAVLSKPSVPVRNPQVDHYHHMWFYDLIFRQPVKIPRIGHPRIEEIQAVVGRAYNVSRLEIICQRRTGNLIRPRQVAMYLCKILTPHSYPQIGRRFGGRDHSTCLHAFRKLEVLVEVDTELAAKIELIKAELRA